MTAPRLRDRPRQKLADLKWRLVSKLQMYLVDSKTHEPVGYLSWGLQLDQTAEKPVITPLKATWTVGKDVNVWKPLN